MGVHYIQMPVNEQQQAVNNVFIVGKKKEKQHWLNRFFRFSFLVELSFSIVRLSNYLTDINVAVWVHNIFQLIRFTVSTRIMGREVFLRTAIKVVVEVVSVKHWTVKTSLGEFGRSLGSITRVRHVFNDLTANTSVLPKNQTSAFRMTNQPVVNVTLYQDLAAKLFPQREVNGVVVCLAERRCCRVGDVGVFFHQPVWSWRDRVWHICEMCVVREPVTPDQSPASSISFHVTVNLKWTDLGTTKRINPINSRMRRRRQAAKGLAR